MSNPSNKKKKNKIIKLRELPRGYWTMDRATKHTMDMIFALESQLQKTNPILHILTSVFIQSPLGFRSMSYATRSLHATLRMIFCFLRPPKDNDTHCRSPEDEVKTSSNSFVHQRLADLVAIAFADNKTYSRIGGSGDTVVPVEWRNMDGPQLTQLALTWVPDLRRLCVFLNKADPDDDVPVEKLEWLTGTSIHHVLAQCSGNASSSCSFPLYEKSDDPSSSFSVLDNGTNSAPELEAADNDGEEAPPVPKEDGDGEERSSSAGFDGLRPWTTTHGGNLDFLNCFLIQLSPALELSFSHGFFQAAFEACHCFLTATCSSTAGTLSTFDADQKRSIQGRAALWCLHRVLQSRIFDRYGSQLETVLRLAEKFPVFKDTLPIFMAFFSYGFEEASLFRQHEMGPKLSNLLTFTNVQLQRLDVVGVRPQFGFELSDFFPLPRELENKTSMSCFLPQHLEFHDASNFRKNIHHFCRYCLNFLLPDDVLGRGGGAVTGFCDDLVHVIQSYLSHRDQQRAALLDTLIRYYHSDCYDPFSPKK
jgi:hypothetical protein